MQTIHYHVTLHAAKCISHYSTSMSSRCELVRNNKSKSACGWVELRDLDVNQGLVRNFSLAAE
jgi:hypothetical protein